MNDWRPVIRQVFGGIWLYAGFLTLWAVMAQLDPERIPAFNWMWLWVPFQWVAWACGGWFLLVAAAWGVQEATTAARGAWAKVTGRVRLAAPQRASERVVVPTAVVPAGPQDDAPSPPSVAQLVYDHMQTRPNHGGRAGELLDEMKAGGLFVIAGVAEPVDAAELAKRLDEAGWPKLIDKRRVGYPGVATGFRHVDQIDFDERVTFRPRP